MIFRKEYYFLSNMYKCYILYKGIKFSCVEAAFQAQKDINRSHEFEKLDGFEAKKLGRRVNMRKDWDVIKIDLMRELLEIIFLDHPELANKLKKINEPIVEENNWGDTFWGCCHGIGQNHLGQLLEEIKSQL